jgi:hypothetical protein
MCHRKSAVSVISFLMILSTGCSVLENTTEDPSNLDLLVDGKDLHAISFKSVSHKSFLSEHDPQIISSSATAYNVSFADGSFAGRRHSFKYDWVQGMPPLAREGNPRMVLSGPQILPVACEGQIKGFSSEGAVCAMSGRCDGGYTGDQCEGPHWYPELGMLEHRAGAYFLNKSNLIFSGVRSPQGAQCAVELGPIDNSLAKPLYRVDDKQSYRSLGDAKAIQRVEIHRLNAAYISRSETYIVAYSDKSISIYYATCGKLRLIERILEAHFGSQLSFETARVKDVGVVDGEHKARVLVSYRRPDADGGVIAVFDGSSLIKTPLRGDNGAGEEQVSARGAQMNNLENVIGFVPSNNDIIITDANYNPPYFQWFPVGRSLSINTYNFKSEDFKTYNVSFW